MYLDHLQGVAEHVFNKPPVFLYVLLCSVTPEGDKDRSKHVGVMTDCVKM
jgi:hypothetical protein